MYTHYRGTSFQFIGQLQDDGATVDLTNATVIAAVHDPSGTALYGNLRVQVSDAVNGVVILDYPAGTINWPVGKARMDSEIIFGDGTSIASEPEVFRIAQSPIVG